MGQPLGQLNGIWTLVFKIGFPSIIALQIWLVSNTYQFRAYMSRPEFSLKDGADLEMRFESKLQAMKSDLQSASTTQRNERQSQVSQLDEKMSRKLDVITEQLGQLRLDLVSHVVSQVGTYPPMSRWTNNYTVP